MKGTLFFMLLLTSTSVWSQQRACGTMEYLRQREAANPRLKEVMMQQEEQISRQTPVYPQLEGFTITGNQVADREAYRNAKLKKYGQPVTKSVYSEKQMLEMRELKRKRYNAIH